MDLGIAGKWALVGGALFIAAALLPGLAVLLGNAADNHAAPVARPLEVAPLPELTGRDVIPGDVAESDAA